jgi:hypothetical protein
VAAFGDGVRAFRRSAADESGAERGENAAFLPFVDIGAPARTRHHRRGVSLMSATVWARLLYATTTEELASRWEPERHRS